MMRPLVLLIGAGLAACTADEPVSRRPIHRYSFGEPPAGEAWVVRDSVGGADGRVLGAGAVTSANGLRLPGGASDVAAHVALPSGLFSRNGARRGGTGEVSLEAWLTLEGNQEYSRIFDFGSRTPDIGRDYFIYAAQVGSNPDRRRLEVRTIRPSGAEVRGIDTIVPRSIGRERHVVVTWHEKSGTIKAYEDAEQVAELHVAYRIDDVADADVWLGRSHFDVDMNAQAEWRELRIYDHALTSGEVHASFRRGPDVR